MSRLRIAFVMSSSGSGWIGGQNYYVNLMKSIHELEDRQIEMVLIVPPEADPDVLARFKVDEVIHTPLVRSRGVLRMAGVAARRWLGRDLTLEYLARRHRIDVFTHSVLGGRASPLRTMVWIPDFQHVRLPAFFSSEECARRDVGNAAIAREATRIILSSHDAKADLAGVHPEAVDKARVLQFVSGAGHFVGGTPLADLQAKYGFEGPFFHVPNQLWQHKNHRIVIDALALLRERGVTPTVLCTGHTEDFRHPGFFEELKAHAVAQGVAGNFRILGLVPYADVTGLMENATAMINPSLFEGWSTTVEEAKSSGKRIILSDIPVHREQAPPGGIYFAPDDPAALAAGIEQVLATHDSDEQARMTQAAIAALPGRLRAFAQTYQAIALEAARRTTGR